MNTQRRYSAPVTIAGAIGCGTLLALAFPPAGIEVLVWFGLAPLLGSVWSLRPSRRRWLRAGALGYLAGLIYFTGSLFWIRESVPAWWNPVLPFSLALYLASYPALFAAFASTVGRPRFTFENPGVLQNALANIGAALLNAAAWTGLELVRGVAFTGFGWNGLGVALWENAPLIQIAEIVGVTGIGFLIVFVTSACSGLLWRVIAEFQARRLRPHLDFAAVALALILVFFFGVNRLSGHRPADTGREQTELRVLIVQANVPIDEKWDPRLADSIYKKYHDLTEPWVTTGGYDLVVWPESSLPYDANDPYSIDFIDRILQLGDFNLLFGSNEETFTEGAFNSAILARGTALQRSVYRKIHLVPFGEYIPLRGTFPPFEWVAGQFIPRDFDRGTSTDPLPLPGTPVSLIPAICFEDTLGRLARKFVRSGGNQLMVTVTNDGWFRQSSGTLQHLANATFRCVEIRRPMIRAANTGVSCIIDPTGSLYDRAAGDGFRHIIADPESGSTFTEGCLSTKVSVAADQPFTFYARHGDLFATFCAVLAIVSAFVQSVRVQRRSH